MPPPGYTEILQENHYYPFGMNMDGPWRVPQGADGENFYQYNGKELNTDIGLGWHDYGARWYDAAIGRWGHVDPLADAAPDWTPYRYAFNNPLIYIDPDGLFETKRDARRHRRQTEGMGWFKGDKVRKQEDGSYAIENRRENSYTVGLTATGLEDGEKYYTVITGSMVASTDVMDMRVEGEGDNRQITLTLRDGSEREGYSGPTTITGTPPDLGPGKVFKAAKGVRTLTKRIKEHLNKLINYRSNPDAYDNMGQLKDVTKDIRDKRIGGRIKKLQREIRKFVGERNKLKDD